MEKQRMKELMAKQKTRCADCGASLLEAGVYPYQDKLFCVKCGDKLEERKFQLKVMAAREANPFIPQKDLEQKVKKELESNKITVPKEEEKKLPYNKVYEWSSYLTLEQSWIDVNNYYWTKEAKRLLRRLKHTKNQLIAVAGLQGSGKTILKAALESELIGVKNVVSTKWQGFEAFMETFNVEAISKKDLQDDVFLLVSKVYNQMGEKPFLEWVQRRWGESAFYIERFLKTRGKNEQIEFFFNETKLTLPSFVEILMKKLGKAFKTRDFYETLSLNYNVLLLDLADYSKATSSYMNRDLSDIQKLWQRLTASGESSLNLVYFIQKELFHGHFFFGKCDVFEIRPLTPEELTEYYYKMFKEYDPFTKEALTEIGALSRGIFRRFKKYILICLDNWYDEGAKDNIAVENVKEWISLNQLVKDMELELLDAFPKSKATIKNAVILLRFLREHGPSSQTVLTNKLFEGYKMGCSRILNKLEVHGYVKAEKEGKEKVWSLT